MFTLVYWRIYPFVFIILQYRSTVDIAVHMSMYYFSYGSKNFYFEKNVATLLIYDMYANYKPKMMENQNFVFCFLTQGKLLTWFNLA